jgi:hypothetical protein
MRSGNSAPTKDRFFIALGLCCAVGGGLYQIIAGLRKEEIELFGFGPFSKAVDGGVFWTAVVIYSLIGIGFLYKGLPMVLGYASNEEEPIQPPETTRGKRP